MGFELRQNSSGLETVNKFMKRMQSATEEAKSAVMPLENFLRKCSMGYALYPWISLLEFTLETFYKPQT